VHVLLRPRVRGAGRPAVGRRYGASIRVKTNVAEVLRRELARPSWQREAVAVGAATDPYQPAEGRYRLTRACIEAFGEAETPFSIITRGPLIVRDTDVLAAAARAARVSVTFSVPTLDVEIWRRTEPGTAPPRQRLRALARLVEAGIDASVGMAPILPGRTSSTSAQERVSTSSPRWNATGPSSSPTTNGSTSAAPTCPGERPIRCGSACACSPAATASATGGAYGSSHLRRPSSCKSPLCNSGAPFYDLPAVATASEITCLIVDDHEVVREGLRLSLSRAPHIRVIGEAADGEAAVALAARRRPNVVIMDVRMPGMDGLEATKALMDKVPDSAVLIFTAYSERSLLSRGLDSGAKGYVLKEAPHETLLRAIEKVASGEGYVDPALMPAFLTGRDKDDMLTGREREILQLLADGMSNADVATQLFISQETVKSHVRHILAKLEADTRTHAVAIALREAIID